MSILLYYLYYLYYFPSTDSPPHTHLHTNTISAGCLCGLHKVFWEREVSCVYAGQVNPSLVEMNGPNSTCTRPCHDLSVMGLVFHL